MLKKDRRILILTFISWIILLGVNTANGQLVIGSNIESLKFNATGVPNIWGIGFHVDIPIRAKFRYHAGYFLPRSAESRINFSAKSWNLNAHFTFFGSFRNDTTSAWTIYGVAGVGYTKFTSTDVSYLNFSERHINLGIGVEYKLENGIRFYFEPKYCFDAYNTWGSYAEPFSNYFDIGVRLPLDRK